MNDELVLDPVNQEQPGAAEEFEETGPAYSSAAIRLDAADQLPNLLALPGTAGKTCIALGPAHGMAKVPVESSKDNGVLA